MDAYLVHYGILRRSGRYPWGSGGNVSSEFRDFVLSQKSLGLSEKQIAETCGMSILQLRSSLSQASHNIRQQNVLMATRLKEKGYSNIAIAERMGVAESSVRGYLANRTSESAKITDNVKNVIRSNVDKLGYVDVGAGTDQLLGVSSDRLNKSLRQLENEGYKVHYVKVHQLGTGNDTSIKVLTKDTVSYSEVFKNRDSIRMLEGYSNDGGRSFTKIYPPKSISSKRVEVVYPENGGADKDGLIEVRPGKTDTSLGGVSYAQVRIAVDGTHYLKGVAVYNKDLPDGTDIRFYTSKKNTGNPKDAMKKMSEDPDMPFSSTIVRQITKTTNGKTEPESVVNIVNEEGSWDSWSRSISSQMLSKQTPALISRQLSLKQQQYENELDTIRAVTNPIVKRELLESYASKLDSAAVSLKAAALPRQSNKVIVPAASLKPNEVYAPSFRNGETVVLIRHPHGGIFEIPELRVNNRNKESMSMIGNALDAIAIHPNTAKQLSGADFDGDSVIVIPNNSKQVKTSKAVKSLIGFDPRSAYPGYPGMKKITPVAKQAEMGKISNLITDMTIKGAPQEEIVRAIKHSMVVIDSEKHGLDYKSSYIDNGIPALKEKYQGGIRGGASTIVSKARSRKEVSEQIPRSHGKGGPIDPKTGALVYEKTGATYVDSKGRTKQRLTRTTQMATTKDARNLSSGTKVEEYYASYANNIKGLANAARKESLSITPTKYSPSAAKVYAPQVETLKAKLAVSLRNAPFERQAQIIANATVKAKQKAIPDMDADTLKKVKNKALADARIATGASKIRVEFTQDEWNAIQAGAVSNSFASKLIKNADLDELKVRSLPQAKLLMTPSKKQRAKALATAGYTQAEIADALGVSLTTLKESL